MTGYINNINTEHTQVLMEYHDKGYAGNIYEYGVKRESMTHWNNTDYYSYDGRGSVSDIVDPNGDVQMYHSYEPDGQTTMRFRSYIPNPYRYNAEQSRQLLNFKTVAFSTYKTHLSKVLQVFNFRFISLIASVPWYS